MRQLEITPLTPEKLGVNWLFPAKFNGPTNDIVYVVKFSTMTAEGLVHREKEHKVSRVPDGNWVQVFLEGLTADQEYTVKVSK